MLRHCYPSTCTCHIAVLLDEAAPANLTHTLMRDRLPRSTYGLYHISGLGGVCFSNSSDMHLQLGGPRKGCKRDNRRINIHMHRNSSISETPQREEKGKPPYTLHFSTVLIIQLLPSHVHLRHRGICNGGPRKGCNRDNCLISVAGNTYENEGERSLSYSREN